MKTKRLRGSIFFLGILLGIDLSCPSFAANGGEVKIPTAAELNRLSRDLIPPSSNDFFSQGKQQLEGFIQQLQQEQFLPKKAILEIVPMPQLEDTISPSLSPEKSNQ